MARSFSLPVLLSFAAVTAPLADEPRVSPVFHLDFVASLDDVDLLGHISNVAYVRWVQDVARAHSESVGWDPRRYQQLGAVFVVRRHEIEYVRPTHAGDPIRLTTWIADWSMVASTRRTRILRNDEEEVARASTL